MDVSYKVYSLLKLYGLNESIARLATAQASFETGRFSSNVYKENNNVFGYKFVGQSLSTGENRGHAVYRDISDSVREFVMYWGRRRMRSPIPFVITTPRAYAEYLGNPNIAPGAFFEVSVDHYTKGLAVHYEELFA